MRRIITNAIWEVLGPLVQAAKRSPVGARPEVSDREFLEAVLYRARTGLPWRDLPPEFGDWSAVYQRWKRWRNAGNFQRLFDSMPAEAALRQEVERLFADSTIIRAHPHAAGGGKTGALRSRGWAGAGAATPPRCT